MKRKKSDIIFLITYVVFKRDKIFGEDKYKYKINI